MALIFMDGFESHGSYDWRTNKFTPHEPKGASLNYMVPDLNTYSDRVRDEVGFLRRQSTERKNTVLGERIRLYAIGRLLEM